MGTVLKVLVWVNAMAAGWALAAATSTLHSMSSGLAAYSIVIRCASAFKAPDAKLDTDVAATQIADARAEIDGTVVGEFRVVCGVLCGVFVANLAGLEWVRRRLAQRRPDSAA